MLLNSIPCPVLFYWATGIVLGGGLFAFVALYLYVCYTLGVFTSKARMDGKTIIITGCTSGIGKVTARDLALRGARVIMACRNVEKANKLKDELIKESKNSNIVVKKLDLASLESVREFARQINAEESKLDILIHNAGTAETFRRKLSVDSIELTMATNQYGPFLLTHLLIDLLKRSKPSRIVIVGSETYRLAWSHPLNHPNPTRLMAAHVYFMSKYANIIWSIELARRLEGSGVTVNCLHPGMIDTDIWRNVPVPLSWPMNFITKCFFKTPEQGAQTTLYVAVSEELSDVNGKYFRDCKEATLSRGIQDAAKARKFWEVCENMVKLKETDPKI